MTEKWDRRDTKVHKRRHGMRVSGRNIGQTYSNVLRKKCASKKRSNAADTSKAG